MDAAAARFHEDGYVILRSVVAGDLVRQLRDVIERRYRDPATHTAEPELDLLRGGVSLMRMFEYHQVFRDVMTLSPVIDLVEVLLGTDCHVVAQNALRTPTGKGIVNWHIDGELFNPLLAHLRHIPKDALPLPCFSLNAMVLLSDALTEEYGPTQVVAGSHLSGRRPPRSQTLPDGDRATTLFARAGDVYLVNNQTWHRGAQNRSSHARYLLTTTYGRRFVSQRFYPFLNYRMPEHVLDGASERLLRLLGQHDKGPFG
ncbi:phytanoyl-CoA dioxygenase family protein [Streptomyces sp. NPDC001339]|uniref:phytanoyl-CoA dioxygenase family protein n=1 Tax=Streptomyces sp. NPDC001339 TaxID=3364563 RepID=UPI0036AC99F0